MKNKTGPLDEVARLLKVLSVETRLRIFCFLKNRPLCVNALAAMLKVTQAAVSQHLCIMRESGLVTASKRGYFVHYRVNEGVCRAWRETIDRLLQTKSVAGNASKRELACAVKRHKDAKGKKQY